MKPNKTPRKHAAFASSSRQMKRRPKVKSLLAVLVAFCTVCALTMPAATLEGQAQASCGLAEHTHDESCYESVLVCGQEEGEGHVHDESCYEEALTCEIPEHTHSEACWAQPETQAEAGNEENSEAVTGDGAGSDMEAAAGTETGTDTEADTGADSSENGDAAEAGSETDSSGNAGTGAGDTGSAEAGDGQTENGGAGSEADGTGENGSGTENAGEQDESTSDEDALTEEDKTEQADGQEQEISGEGALTEEVENQPAIYTAKVEEAGQIFNVIVTAPDGAFASEQSPVLHVDAITDENELEQTAAVLEEDNVDFDGMLAVDVYFTDGEDGQEIEPAQTVSVRFELSQDALSEDIDASTLAVHHFAEKQNGDVQVETVATSDTEDSIDGIVAVSSDIAAQAENSQKAAVIDEIPELEAQTGESIEAPALVAEFKVEGFSSFTLTWRQNSNTSDTVKVILWDAVEDEELDVNTVLALDKTLQNEETFYFTNENIPTVPGYEFVNAIYGRNLGEWFSEEGEIESIAAKREPYYNWFGQLRYRWRYYINGNEDNTTSAPTIRLYYIPTGGSTTPSEPVTPEPGHEKTVVWNEEASAYDLTLTVQGTIGSQTQQAPVDVLMIVDTSNSMKGSKLRNTKLAMRSLVGALEDDPDIDAWYDIVRFSSKNNSFDGNGTAKDATNLLSWTNDVTHIYRIIGTAENDGRREPGSSGSLEVWGGTNYQAGLRMAAENLNNPHRTGAIKIVIFLSDGNPTYYIGGGDGSNSLPRTGGYTRGWNATKEEAGKITCDRFYSIRIGDADEGYLTDLRDAVHAGTESRYISANDDGSNLSDIFSNIAAETTELAVTNVKIEDTLTQWVEPVLVNGEPIITGSNLPEGTQINYDSGTRKLTVQLPENYELDPELTYSVTMRIQPSQAAEIYYAQNGTYPSGMDGDTGTGTHEGEEGFFSNEGAAKLYYRYPNDENDRDADYLMPVVQVRKGYLQLSKVMAQGTTAEEGETFSFTISIPGNYAGTYNALYSSDSEGNGTTVTFESSGNNAVATVQLAATESVVIALPDNIQVSITENTEDYTPGWIIDGVNQEGDSVTVNTNKATRTQVVCENTLAAVNITVTKMDEELQKPLKDAEFYLYKLDTDGETKLYYPNAGSTWIASIEQAKKWISNENGIFTIEGLEDGAYYLEENKAPDGYVLPESDVRFVVEEGVIINTSINNENSYEGTNLSVPNTTGAELPETGGPGTTILTIGGLLLMAGAVGGGCGLRRRRGKEGR